PEPSHVFAGLFAAPTYSRRSPDPHFAPRCALCTEPPGDAEHNVLVDTCIDGVFRAPRSCALSVRLEKSGSVQDDCRVRLAGWWTTRPLFGGTLCRSRNPPLRPMAFLEETRKVERARHNRCNLRRLACKLVRLGRRHIW